jgi:hypothetical protein
MKRFLHYLWASPATLLGLIFVPLAYLSGGKVQVVNGVIEISGGLVSQFLEHGMLVIRSAGAMTLGHVVLGQDERSLVVSRRHERVHVAQYERWGPLMIPFYLISSGAAALVRKHPYWDNRFEREAFTEEGADNESIPASDMKGHDPSAIADGTESL